MRTKILVAVVAALFLIGGCGDATDDIPDVDTEPPDTDVETDTESPDTDVETPETEGPTTEGAYSEACGEAVRQVSEVADLQSAAEELDHAISTCDSVEELRAAVDDLADIDVPIDALVAERCADATADDAVGRSPVCAELG